MIFKLLDRLHFVLWAQAILDMHSRRRMCSLVLTLTDRQIVSLCQYSGIYISLSFNSSCLQPTISQAPFKIFSNSKYIGGQRAEPLEYRAIKQALFLLGQLNSALNYYDIQEQSGQLMDELVYLSQNKHITPTLCA